jgi:hypothetical protein
MALQAVEIADTIREGKKCGPARRMAVSLIPLLAVADAEGAGFVHYLVIWRR